MNLDELKSCTLDLERWVRERDYSGYDPYDGMNSRFLDVLPLPGKYPKIAWIQFFKKFPVNLRPLFLVKPGINPKGMGLFLSSYVQLYQATQDEQFLDAARSVAEWLAGNSSEGYAGKCWGYNFNWQSRAFYVPKGTPTIVNTSFVGHALLDLFELTGHEAYLADAESACRFITTDLNVSVDAGEPCFSYTPIDELRVHNANLLGCGLINRVDALMDRETEALVDDCMMFSINHQLDEGEWYYAEPEYQHWIDSFHTGFNLMSLRYCERGPRQADVERSVRQGEAFYRENFFEPDGTPWYYHNRQYPIDVHCPAMALRYFSTTGNPADLEMCGKIAGWLCDNMRNPDGSFMFQLGKAFVNRIPYMRWGQAWALYGLSYLLNQSS